MFFNDKKLGTGIDIVIACLSPTQKNQNRQCRWEKSFPLQRIGENHVGQFQEQRLSYSSVLPDAAGPYGLR
jgi:hypothetical protein